MYREDKESEEKKSDCENFIQKKKNWNKVKYSQDKEYSQHNHHVFTIRDVEESLLRFANDDKLSVLKWINEMKEMSIYCIVYIEKECW